LSSTSKVVKKSSPIANLQFQPETVGGHAMEIHGQESETCSVMV
jgi:hypothetical protein